MASLLVAFLLIQLGVCLLVLALATWVGMRRSLAAGPGADADLAGLTADPTAGEAEASEVPQMRQAE